MKTRFLQVLFIVICCISDAFGMQRDTTYKYGDFLIDANGPMKVDFIIKKAPNKKRISVGDTLYEDKKYLILGDHDKVPFFGVYRKYKLRYKFSDFPAAIYKGKLTSPSFKTDPKAKLFKTQIKDQCKADGINFAGHYTITVWGCGSDCQVIAIVDRLNGKIYYSSLLNFELSHGVKYKPNSRMLILNPGLLDRHNGYVNCSFPMKVEVVDWINSRARRLPE